MADPKYANLPGIDTESPDVYETSDLPEDDQAQILPDDIENEQIDRTKISASEAHKKFKGKDLDASSTDFSDRVGPSRRTGYEGSRTEYEMLGEGAEVKETPLQRYQRLQHEMRELLEEVNAMKETVKADASTEGMSPVAIAKQVEYLQQQVTDLHVDKVLGTSQLSLADPQGALHKRLIDELQSYSPDKPGKKSEQPGAAEDSAHVTYQLYFRPEQAKFSNNAKMADLEQRLERMEAVIGCNPEKMSMITAETQNKSIMEGIALLHARTKLLDPSQLEHVEGRLVALSQRLGQVSQKKEAVEDAEKQNKISELYDLVKKWDTVADSLPHVVDRLTGLKDLHEQALQFSQALTHLDTAQQQIHTLLQAHGDMLKEVQSSLKDNMAVMKTNCESIEGRLKALNK